MNRPGTTEICGRRYYEAASRGLGSPFDRLGAGHQLGMKFWGATHDQVRLDEMSDQDEMELWLVTSI